MFSSSWAYEAMTQANIEIRVLTGHAYTNEFALDDLSFVIPEPASGVFFIMSVIGGVWVRRLFIV